MQNNPSSDEELKAIIKQFETKKREGKILYLDADQYIDIAEKYLEEERDRDAFNVLKVARQIHPDNVPLTIMSTTLLIDNGKLKDARKMLDEVLDDQSFGVRLTHAELLMQEGGTDEGKEILESFIDQELDELDCIDIGCLWMDCGFHEKGLYWLNRALEIDPENEEALSALCECYQGLDDFQKTIDIYNRLIDKQPYSAAYWTGLGRSYFKLEQPDKAIEACDFAIVSDKKSAGDAYAIKAHAYYQLENYREALIAYKEARKLKSLEEEYATTFIAYCYIALEEWENAYAYLREALIKVRGKDSVVLSSIYFNIAQCLQKMGKHKEARQSLEYIIDPLPDYADIYLKSAQYFLNDGDMLEALDCLEKAVEIRPDAQTWNDIGLITMENGEYEIAQDAFEQARMLDPDYQDIEKNLAAVFRKISKNGGIFLGRRIIKLGLRNKAAAAGVDPIKHDIEFYASEAEKDGYTPRDIEILRNSLEKLNELIEYYDIDQEEDKEEDEDDILF